MAKEYQWEVGIDGVCHHVSCTATGNKYEIWVDEEHLTVVYRRGFRAMSRGLEQEFQIGGKSCLFLVWDERPDLVVDGILQRSGKDFLKEKAKRNKHMVRALWCLFTFGIAVLGVAVASICFGIGDDAWDWFDYGAYILAGVWIMVDAMLEMKYWKEQ